MLVSWVGSIGYEAILSKIVRKDLLKNNIWQSPEGGEGMGKWIIKEEHFREGSLVAKW